MAENEDTNEDRTEDATPERREEFRERGHVVSSRELSSVCSLGGAIFFFAFYGFTFYNQMAKMLVEHFENIGNFEIQPHNIHHFLRLLVQDTIILVAPVFLIVATISAGLTLLQTNLNFSWEKVKPDFTRIDPLKGIARLVSWNSVVELLKGIAKVTAVITIAYLVLKSEWIQVPGLMMHSVENAWSYWAGITKQMFWGVVILLVVISALDYIYNFFAMEKKLRMTKQEVKEDYKKREVDPQIKGRIKKMQRDFAYRRVLDKTKQATVLITNPEHFAIAIHYELGMAAPVVLTKGADFLALRMREIAKSMDIPIVENKPLARTLFKTVKEGDVIPESLYRAVSEVIRYVFRLKGIQIQRQKSAEAAV